MSVYYSKYLWFSALYEFMKNTLIRLFFTDSSLSVMAGCFTIQTLRRKSFQEEMCSILIQR